MASLSKMPLKNLHKFRSSATPDAIFTTATKIVTQFTSFPTHLFVTTRCFNSHASTDGNNSSVPSRCPGPYPFQETGPRTPFELKPMREGLFVRMDMPGVADDEVQVFVHDKTLFFKGEARKEAKNWNFDSPRTYLGSFDLCSPSHQIGDIKSEMKNGVLRMLVHSSNI